jgi:hypothetical protein
VSVNGSPRIPRLPVPTYRDYRPGDERQIVELMSPYWEHINSSNDWTHEYRDSPDGPGISRICEIDDCIVAHHGLIPMQMCIDKQNVSGAKSEGIIINAGFRRNSPLLGHLPPEERSIFDTLIRHTWEAGTGKGIIVAWGFPNSMSQRGFLRAGWDNWPLYRRTLIRPVNVTATARYLSGMAPRWIRPFMNCLAPVPLWLLTRNLQPLKGNQDTRVARVEEFDEGVDRFWQRLTGRHRINSINRTCRHLNWRFAHEPYVKTVLLSEGELGGYAIGLPEEKNGVLNLRIVDLLLDADLFPSLGQLLGGLLESAGSNIDLLIINYYYRGCDYGERLGKEIRKYFLPASRLHPQAAIIRLSDACDNREAIKDPSNWLVSDLFRELF